jgi:hypothetical protein
MIVSYMDETGHFNDPASKYVGMAGFAAPAEIWEPFGKLWNLTITRDPFRLTRPFHMREFAHRRGEFKGWSEEKRQALYGRLIEMILLIKPVPIGAIVSIDDFKTLTTEQQSDLKSPYHLAFQTCTRGAAILGLVPAEIRMVYSENIEYGAVERPHAKSKQIGDADLLWRSIKELTIFGQWMESCSFSTPIETIPLQAADLFAYELYKEFENQQRRPNDPMRWGLRQILSLASAEHVLIRLYDRKEMLRTIVEAGMPHQDGAEEVGNIDVQWATARKARADWITTRAVQPDMPSSSYTEKL